MSARRQGGRNARGSAHPDSPIGLRANGHFANQLLERLDEPTFARLKPLLEPIQLETKEVLFRANEPLEAVYFPSSAIVSLVSRLASGELLEVGLIGRDGVVGIAACPDVTTMPCDGIVQIPGLAHRMTAEVLRREFMTNEALSSVIGRFWHTLLARSMQMAICNMFHPVEQRCIRWLLSVRDLIDHHDVPLTHDLLATMLGVHRPTVTLVIRSLHRAGMVNEGRGRITIRDRSRLVEACCECYRVIRDA